MTSPLAILDANQFFISVIEKYPPIFTSFVFPDQYLKPKGYSEKWPTLFFRTSIPNDVPKHYIAYGNKRIKCLMPYFLFTLHFKWCGNSSRGLLGRPGTKGQWSQQCTWGGHAVLLASARRLRDPFCCGRLFQDSLIRPLWHLAPPEDRAPPACLKDVDLRGTGPRGLPMDGRAFVLPGGELCRRHQSLAPGWHVLPLQLGFGWIAIPPKVTVFCFPSCC